MSDETGSQLEEVLSMLKVLADESRLRMLGILADRECSGVELAELLDLRAATVSHHLVRLRQLGLVTVRAEGTRRLYRLDASALAAFRDRLDSPRQLADLVPEARPGVYAQRVLGAFVEGQALKRIPATRRKRDIVLEWIAGGFRPGEELSEAQVNERLGRHHWDTATLRRELVGGGWMTRSGGVYRRVERSLG